MHGHKKGKIYRDKRTGKTYFWERTTEKKAEKDEYADWLSKQRWDWFWTGTFRKNYSVDGARRASQRFFEQFPGLELAVIFIEPGELYGKIHTHGVLNFNMLERPPITAISSRWWKSYGYCRIEPPRDVAGVSRYVSKYITKNRKDETYIVI